MAATEAMIGLPRQIIHNDGHAANLLRTDPASDRVTGLIDFGDLVHTVTVADIAVSAASLVPHQSDPTAALASLAGGYHACHPLSADEVEALPDLVLVRLVLSTLHDRVPARQRPASRSRRRRRATRHAGQPGGLARHRSRQGGGSDRGEPVTDDDLRRRRAAVLAPSYQLFYDEPVHLVRGDGVWLFDAEGNRYLDCYNNVPSVGHAHPRVVAALADQTGLLNTHTRYLHEHVVELAERLGASLPGELSTCYFVCTGTEANDLAVQIARAVTGQPRGDGDRALVPRQLRSGRQVVDRLVSRVGTTGMAGGGRATQHLPGPVPPARHRPRRQVRSARRRIARSAGARAATASRRC